MAYIATINAKTGRRTGQKITHEKAIAILDVLEGRKEPVDEKQEAFILTVHKVYFDWRQADPLWIMNNLDSVAVSAVAEWRVDGSGRPTRPDTDKQWQFAKKYLLWSNGAPANQAKNIIDRYQLRTKGYK